MFRFTVPPGETLALLEIQDLEDLRSLELMGELCDVPENYAINGTPLLRHSI
jgi:hypothetical protein